MCYELFCGRTCMRNTIPFPDILTNICRDLDLCKEYAEKMRSMRSMANPAKELMTEHAEFCDYDPVVVLQVRAKERGLEDDEIQWTSRPPAPHLSLEEQGQGSTDFSFFVSVHLYPSIS